VTLSLLSPFDAIAIVTTTSQGLESLALFGIIMIDVFAELYQKHFGSFSRKEHIPESSATATLLLLPSCQL
jgi:hypothetical protein